MFIQQVILMMCPDDQIINELSRIYRKMAENRLKPKWSDLLYRTEPKQEVYGMT